MQFFTTIATMVAAASAIMINQPAMNAVLNAAQDQTVSWTSVDTDPSSVSVYLVNFSRYPTVSTLIQANVATSADGITIPSSMLTAGTGYQINLIATTNPTQILAQSNQFSITGSAASSAVASSSSAAVTTMTTSSKTATTAAAQTSAAASSAAPVVSSGNNSTVAASNSTLPSISHSSTSGSSINMASKAALLFVSALFFI